MRLYLLPFLFCCVLISSCAYQAVPPPSPSVSDSKRLLMVQAHLLLGQWELAKKQLDQVRMADQDRDYWRLVSLYWLSVESHDKALAVHNKVLQKYPDDDFIWNNYGVLLGLKQRWVEACDAFEKADKSRLLKRQSVQINLSRCAIRQNQVNLAGNYLKQAKEIADLPLIGLMTELNLVLIQGTNDKARLIFNNIQADKEIARGSVHFDEYNCLSRHLIARETDPTLYSLASNFTCLHGSRY
ncbi:tetratricopeptide repeat protein [Marinomonas shanghaiensis]|uniref:tetratricopeptide repeat protein n=1 Tax=Marinomonas shanghaiensis TaxID=2202418 RepID=UPI003A905513